MSSPAACRAVLVSALLLQSVLALTVALEACPKYMGSGHCGAETSRCNLKTSEYLHGAWNRRPASCEVRNHADLMSIAYNFTNTCYGADFDCRPEAFPCYKRSLEVANWLWQPADCCLSEFDAEKFDRMLGKDKLTVVGDSLGAQQFSSLGYMLRAVIVSGTVDHPPLKLRSGGTVAFAHHRHLIDDSKPDSEALTVDHWGSWAWDGRESKYVIFNTGHHWWHMDPDFKQYEAMIRKVFEYMRDNFPTQKIFFRTSNMGHVAPEHFSQPLIGPYMPKRQNEWYRRWVQIQQEETLWATLAPQYQLENRFLVLNISFTDARADAHTNFRVTLNGDKHADWLHYCTPGVPDWWNWLVYNALEQIAGT